MRGSTAELFPSELRRKKPKKFSCFRFGIDIDQRHTGLGKFE